MKVHHCVLVPVVCKAFQDLGVGATLVRDGQWMEIHEQPSLTGFELQHGVLTERYAYNDRCMARVHRQKSDVLGVHAGLHDLFVPICVEDRVAAVLVTGPVATSRPNRIEVVDRWRALTGRQGHPADPEFAGFLAATFSTLVLEGGRLSLFRRLIGRLAMLMACEGPAERLASEIAGLRRELAGARFVERVWDAVREMVDEKTSRFWASPYREDQLLELGLPRLPERVAVGLLVSQKGDADPVDDLLRRHAFQRACVGLGQKAGRIATGKIGDHGVTFLAGGERSAERSRRRLLQFAEEASAIARRSFGLGLHIGATDHPDSLPRQFQTALAAAESALSRGVPLVRSTTSVPIENPLGRLRQELGQLVEENPRALPARFDHFVEAVAVRCGYQREPVRAHLEAGFERMTEALQRSEALEPRGFESLCAAVDEAAALANTVSELFATYRRAAREIADAVLHPAEARHDRSLLRVDEYLRRHYAEPLKLGDVAKIAGFAPSYFSQLFHKQKRMTLTSYLIHLRVARAKELLANTSLGLDRVAEIAGLARRQYLSRVFTKSAGESPSAYRRRVQSKAKFRFGERNKVFA